MNNSMSIPFIWHIITKLFNKYRGSFRSYNITVYRTKIITNIVGNNNSLQQYI